MNFLGPHINAGRGLLSRNEGKIKDYGSCTDVRAWSHDSRARDCHLRQWIKSDMPICVFPISTLASFLSTMTCRRRGRATPRCHPDCKSKAMLDSLCSSCHVINKCLKCDSDLDKYFEEEELDTSHWPCDKCLDVLKSIKMFWKIIIEKVFGISIPKCEDLKFIQNDRIDSVKSIAKLWEDEIVQQTFFVTPLLSKGLNRTINNLWKPTPVKKETPSRIPKPCRSLQKDPSKTVKFNKAKSPTHSFISHRTRTIDTGRSSSSFTRNNSRSSRNKLQDCTSARVRKVDVACTCELDRTNDELIIYKHNVEYLQQKCTRQEKEIENFRRENISLKRELQIFYKTSPCFKSHSIENVSSNCDVTALIPKPFESCIEDGATTDKMFNNTDSEMIITMKNCKNESFKHVSLLQVLHKTNEPLASDVPIHTTGKKKENPIELLTKVQKTFGAIVKREIRLVCRQKHSKKHVIDASFCNLSNSKSAPSCSTLYTEATSSTSNFMTGCD